MCPPEIAAVQRWTQSARKKIEWRCFQSTVGYCNKIKTEGDIVSTDSKGHHTEGIYYKV